MGVWRQSAPPRIPRTPYARVCSVRRQLAAAARRLGSAGFLCVRGVCKGVYVWQSIQNPRKVGESATETPLLLLPVEETPRWLSESGLFAPGALELRK